MIAIRYGCLKGLVAILRNKWVWRLGGEMASDIDEQNVRKRTKPVPVRFQHASRAKTPAWVDPLTYKHLHWNSDIE